MLLHKRQPQASALDVSRISYYTADASQGREPAFVFLNLVATSDDISPEKERGIVSGVYTGQLTKFMLSPERINVALTRAEYGSVLVCKGGKLASALVKTKTWLKQVLDAYDIPFGRFVDRSDRWRETTNPKMLAIQKEANDAKMSKGLVQPQARKRVQDQVRRGAGSGRGGNSRSGSNNKPKDLSSPWRRKWRLDKLASRSLSWM